ncbi:unnamed protein product [Linum tenue]|uniref:DEUBAD domain-containing protein n=1 Tax=Linum tenue TaxID=586396 RepID=A0AAV0QM13_9ROSI|nr:unnamed protein product [Linum tenue]
MAIEKNNFKVSRFDPDSSPNSRGSMSSDDNGGDDGDDNELHRKVSAAESDDEGDDDEFDDADSGAGSDDFDLLELGDTGAEFCQIGDLTCSVPFELYDLSGLEDILSVDVWNDVLSEEERVSLTKYLPDMDELTCMQTLKELFEGTNVHFGSPMKMLFQMLKGGLCEPRVALYKEGLTFFQKRQHYHLLRNYQNNLVSNLCEIRDAWLTCRGYSIDDKLRVLKIMKSQKSLLYGKMDEDIGSDSSEKLESGDNTLWDKGAKDRKGALKLNRNSLHMLASPPDFSSRIVPQKELAKYGKQSLKGMLKLAGSKAPPSFRDMRSPIPSHYDGMEMNTKAYGLPVPLLRQNKHAAYESAGPALRLQDQIRIRDSYDYDDYEDNDEAMHLVGAKQDRIMAHGNVIDKSRGLKLGRNKQRPRRNNLGDDSFMGSPFSLQSDINAYGKHRNTSRQPVEEMFTKPPHVRSSDHQMGKKMKYSETFQQFPYSDKMNHLKLRGEEMPLKGNRVDSLNASELIWHNNRYEQAFPMDSSSKYDEFNIRSKKRKPGRDSPDFNSRGYGASSHLNDRILLSEMRERPLREKARRNFVQNGAHVKGTTARGKGMYMRGEDTESDSSQDFDQGDEEEDNTPLIHNKSLYSQGMETSKSSFSKSRSVAKRASSYVTSPDVQENSNAFEGVPYLSKNVDVLDDDIGHVSGHLSRAKHKGKMHDSSPLDSSDARMMDSNRKGAHKLGKNGGRSRGDSNDRVRMLSLKSNPSERNQKALESHDYSVDEEDGKYEEAQKAVIRLGKKGHKTEPRVHNNHSKSDVSLLACNTVTKKRAVKVEATDGREEDVNMESTALEMQKMDDPVVPLKKKGKKKARIESVAAADLETQEPPEIKLPEVEVVEIKPQKKPYIPITPTVHTCFSFSIVHLLSAVRSAMITPLPEDSLEVVTRPIQENRPHDEDGGTTNGFVSPENLDAPARSNVPSLTVQEIVNLVRSNPGDPCILETQEPLQDLVRGVLKIFSSRSAPLGAKGWKALVMYEKETKSWSWVGPVSQNNNSADQEAADEEVTSPEYWGLPHKMLVKLVDSFANWLKSGQETLQQIGSLPEPPLSMMQTSLDEKERFRDLRAQKSLSTINPSSEEVRTYFRKEEVLRYSIPDRAFSYTAADGRKSIVAPLRRCGGKPTSKARDHFMLKRDRPPHVTILCLVRDAAARLPGSIGTRADVCTLIRDSQFVVEDVSDAQVNQVVSGALDRLHYERDPCVQFDGDRKLWVYLHREREEEDFEDDGTSSTKKWKRQKKDPAADQSSEQEVGVSLEGLNGTGVGNQSGLFEPGSSDLNVDPPGGVDDDDGRRDDVNFGDLRQDDVVDAGHLPEHGGNMLQDHHHSMVWDALSSLDVPPHQDHPKLRCHENSTDQDFDDETFGEPPGGLLSSSL